MSFTWKDKVNEVDDILAEDINLLASGIKGSEKAIQANNEAISANAAALNTHKSDSAAHSEAMAGERLISNRQYANAIRGTKSGGVIQIDDVSPLERTVKVKVSSKNLFDASKIADGLFYYEDGSHASADDFDYFMPETMCYEGNFPYYNLAVQPGESYKISGYAHDAYEGLVAPLVLMASTSEEIGYVEGETLGTYPVDGNIDTWTYFELTFTVPDDATVVYFYLSHRLWYKDIVLKKVSEQSVTSLTVCGKNLFDSSKLLKASGWTENNGVYSGLPGNTSNLYNITSENGLMSGVFLPNTQYTFSFTGYSVGASAGKVGMTFGVQYDDGTSDVLYITASSATNYVFTSDENKTIVRMNTSFGYNYTTYLSNIQLEKGAVATEYEPYAATTYTPNADGTCEIPSVSPNMTILSDAAGVNMEAEYNRDTNAVIHEMANAIIALGGTL